MPNYVANILTVLGSKEQVAKVIEFVKGDERVFDFNKILLMPESLNIDSSSAGDDGMEYLIAKNKKFDFQRSERDNELIARFERYSKDEQGKRLELGRKYLRNLADYGVTTWYDWNIANWGTKWNSCDAVLEGNWFKFDTAWNAPIPVFKKLSELFPAVTFEFIYADEDCGCNTGRGTAKRGEIELYNPEDDSSDAYDLYFATHEWAKEEMHQDEDGQWVWNED